MQHIAIILDGNRRWAKQHALSYGYDYGYKVLKDIIRYIADNNICPYLTVFLLSLDNLKRSQLELNTIYNVLHNAALDQDRQLINARFHFIGNKTVFPDYVLCDMQSIELDSQNKKGLTVNLAMGYSGKWDIRLAAQKIAYDLLNNNITKDELRDLTNVDSTLFNRYTSLGSNIPDPDILIRTGNEKRISDFLLWNLSYTELFFIAKMWPDFTTNDLTDILIEYKNRSRKFGIG